MKDMENKINIAELLKDCPKLIMKYIYIILYAIVAPIFWVANCFAQLMTKVWIWLINKMFDK